MFSTSLCTSSWKVLCKHYAYAVSGERKMSKSSVHRIAKAAGIISMSSIRCGLLTLAHRRVALSLRQERCSRTKPSLCTHETTITQDMGESQKILITPNSPETDATDMCRWQRFLRRLMSGVWWPQMVRRWHQSSVCDLPKSPQSPREACSPLRDETPAHTRQSPNSAWFWGGKLVRGHHLGQGWVAAIIMWFKCMAVSVWAVLELETF